MDKYLDRSTDDLINVITQLSKWQLVIDADGTVHATVPHKQTSKLTAFTGYVSHLKPVHTALAAVANSIYLDMYEKTNKTKDA